MSAIVWGIEWRLALSRKRDLALRVLAPLSVVFVIATGAVPPGAGVAIYAVLFVAFGHFSAALPVLHDAETGIVSRVVRGGVSPASYVLQRTAARAALAVVELLPASLVAAAFLNASTSEILIALGALTICLWIGSLMGVMAAAMSRSATEAGVLCGAGLLLLLHMSGVFSTPAPGGFGSTLEAVSPFRALHEAFVTMVAGGPVGGFVTSAVWAVALTVIVAAAAPRLTASLERAS